MPILFFVPFVEVPLSLGQDDLIRRSEQTTDGYSRALQAARVRAAYQRSYFAPALFSLVPVATDLIASMAVDAHWRLYYNDAWVARHTVEEQFDLDTGARQLANLFRTIAGGEL